MIRILVAEESPRITGNILKRLGREDDVVVCGIAKDGEYAVQEALRLQPDVALVDAQLPGMDGIQTTEMLAQHLPHTGVIMTSMNGENEAYRHAMLAGAREFLQKPFTGDELVAAVRRVHAYEHRKSRSPLASVARDGRPAQVPFPDIPAIPSTPPGQIITVLSGKGGVGKSVVAANLAVALGRRLPGRVVLVDMSLQFGDIGALLNVHTERTIADLAANDAVADREVIEEVLALGPGSVKVLLAPVSPELADYVTTAHLRALMDELKRTYDFILVDSPSYLNEITLDAIEMADRIVLVTDLSVTSVKNTRLVLSVLDVLKVAAARLIVVGNHRERSGELERSNAELFLGAPITAEIPHDPVIIGNSVAAGVPFVVSHPQAEVSVGIEELGSILAPVSQSVESALRPPADGDKKKRQRRILGFARG